MNAGAGMGQEEGRLTTTRNNCRNTQNAEVLELIFRPCAEVTYRGGTVEEGERVEREE